MKKMLLLLIALAGAAGCEPPVPPTTERIIRIQIEGCADATPLPVVTAPPASQVAVAPTEPPPPATETAIVAAPTRVPRTPPPPERTADAMAEDYRLRHEEFLSALAEKKLSPADVQDAYDSFRRSEDFQRARNYDEALRYVEVATLDVRSVKIGEPFILRKFKRVEARVEEARPKLSPADQKAASNTMAQAHQAFLNNQFKKANNLLYEVEKQLDLRLKKPPAR